MPTQPNQCKLTVIVPVYNRAKLLTRCLDSIASQSMRPLSLIVVDNNSSDNSLEVAKAWARTNSPGIEVSIISETRPGAARARQTGLEQVTTEWVQFFDSDDVMAPDILPESMRVSNDCDLVCWKRELVGLDSRHSVAPYRPAHIFHSHLYNGMLSTQSYVIRTEFLKGCGGWNPASPVWDDWELGFRILLRKPRIRCLDRVGAIVYSQEESITGTSFHAKAGLWEGIIDLVESYVPASPKIIEMLDYRRVNLAALYSREGHSDLGIKLLNETLRKTNCNAPKRLLLRLIYHYTRLGGRGAYHLWH